MGVNKTNKLTYQQNFLCLKQSRTPFTRGSLRGQQAPPPLPQIQPIAPERRSFERIGEHARQPSRDRPLSVARTAPTNMLLEGIEPSYRPTRPMTSRNSSDDDLDFQGGTGFQSADFGDSLELLSNLSDSPKGSHSPVSGVSTHQPSIKLHLYNMHLQNPSPNERRKTLVSR